MAGNVPSITERDPARLNQAIRDLFAGKSNAVGTVTLTASDTTTTVSAMTISATASVFLMPAHADAATAWAAGLYISAVTGGSFEITHASDASTDQTFYWVALG